MSEQPAEHLARLKVQFPLWAIRRLPGEHGFCAERMAVTELAGTLDDLERQIRLAEKAGRFTFLRGDRVRLAEVPDDYQRFAVRTGDKGTVTLVDSIGTIHIGWDNGKRIGIVAEDAAILRKTGGHAAT